MVQDIERNENDCIFCKISNQDIPSKRIYENVNFFSIYDQNQDIPGHSLVISKKHFSNILYIPKNLSEDMLDCIKETSKKLMDKYSAQGFNVLGNNGKVSGQLINHFHIHIIPRKSSDNVQIPF